MPEKLLYKAEEAAQVLGISKSLLSRDRLRLFRPDEIINVGTAKDPVYRYKRSSLERITGQKLSVHIEDYITEIAEQIAGRMARKSNIGGSL